MIHLFVSVCSVSNENSAWTVNRYSIHIIALFHFHRFSIKFIFLTFWSDFMLYFHLPNVSDVWAWILCLLVVGWTNHDLQWTTNTNCTLINVIPNGMKNRNGPKTQKKKMKTLKTYESKRTEKIIIAEPHWNTETQQGKRASNRHNN